jgi:hypothetical protein
MLDASELKKLDLTANRLEYEIIDNYIEYHDGKTITNRNMIEFPSRYDESPEKFFLSLQHITQKLIENINKKGFHFTIDEEDSQNVSAFKHITRMQTIFTYTIKRL